MAETGSSEPLEAALDELYGVEPADFVATRTRLAAELRASGDKFAAKSIQDARRPTTAAWALNQLLRRDPELVGALLGRSRELADVQADGITGNREAMRDATRAQRDALATTTEAALAVLGARATDAYRMQVRATLQAASADESVGEQLRTGRLVKEVSGATGFPDARGLTLVPDLPERAGTTERVRRPDRAKPAASAELAADAERRRLERERAARELVERRLQEAVAAADAAQDDAVAAESVAAEARERVEQLEHDAVEARRAAREADDAADLARREATRLARAATKLRTRNP